MPQHEDHVIFNSVWDIANTQHIAQNLVRMVRADKRTIFAFEAVPLHQNHGITVSPLTKMFWEFRDLEMLEMRARCSVGFLSTNGWQADWSFSPQISLVVPTQNWINLMAK